MSKYNVTTVEENTAVVQGHEVAPFCAPGSDRVKRADYPAYVGLDVHKETIAVSVAYAGREAPRYWGEIANEEEAIATLVLRLRKDVGGERLLFCYEAGPCGYGLYRQLVSSGQDCEVVAPSLMLRAPGERIKTDRRDSDKLSAQLRSGVLTRVWVPDTEQEAMRDLSRLRGDMKAQECKARQQLNAFVLRQGHHWPSGRSRWTQAHYAWLESLTFTHAWQKEVRDAYVAAVRAAGERVAQCNARLNAALSAWSLGPLVPALSALRGIDQLAAIGVLAELGDISRFSSPRQLMAYLGLVPQVHSSGARCRRGGITRTGNTHARRLLVECAWSYRFPARRTAHMRRKVAQAPQSVQAVAWRAQERLCGRYRHLQQAGKNTKQTTVAVARELVGFIWHIVCQEMPVLTQANTRGNAC